MAEPSGRPLVWEEARAGGPGLQGLRTLTHLWYLQNGSPPKGEWPGVSPLSPSSSHLCHISVLCVKGHPSLLFVSQGLRGEKRRAEAGEEAERGDEMGERGLVCPGPACGLPFSGSGAGASSCFRAPASAHDLAILPSCPVLPAPPAHGQHLCPAWPSDPRGQVFAKRLSRTHRARPQGQRPLRPGPWPQQAPHLAWESVRKWGQRDHVSRDGVCHWVQWLRLRMSGGVTTQRTQGIKPHGSLCRQVIWREASA